MSAGGGAGVVGAEHEDGDLGLDAVEFAVLDPPDDVLGLVAADAEVGGLVFTVERFPDMGAGGVGPTGGD